MKAVAVIIFILILNSCASPVAGSKILVELNPIHEPYGMLADGEISIAQLIDNDGNLYVTRWHTKSIDNENFMKVSKQCDNEIKGDKYFNAPLNIEAIDINNIKPSNYKIFISCIAKQGYKFDSSDGFYPNGFTLTIHRFSAETGEYIPVGSKQKIKTGYKLYKDVFNIVKKCKERLSANVNYLVEESSFGGFIYVNIESYVVELNECVSGA